MSEDAHLSEPSKPYDPRNWGWSCPHCDYYGHYYSESGRSAFAEQHLRGHGAKLPENAPVKTPGQLMQEWSEKVLGIPLPPKDYNKLELTVADKSFLKTRGVSIKEWEPNG